GSNFLLRGAMLCLHALDGPCHECVYAFPLRAGYLRVHHRLRARPRRTFRVKNARQVLSLARLIVDDPAFRSTDVKRSFRAVNYSAWSRFFTAQHRSEERRVGKECRTQWARED